MAESTLESPSGFEHRTPGYQGFIQALLLTSVFHNGLSFMTVGHKPTYISTLMLVVGGSYEGLQAPLVESRGNAPGNFDYFTNPRFSNTLSMYHSVT